MKKPRKSIFLKILKITGISIGSVLLLLFILPYLFPDTVSAKIKGWVNQAVTSKVEFSKARLSFFNHFPSLTLTLYDISLTGSKPFEADTLVASKELSFGINLFSLFSKSIKIDQIFLTNAQINLEVDKQGNANYNIYKSSASSSDTSASQTGLRLEKIAIENSNLLYNDQSIPFVLQAQNLNYTGKGDLSKSVFDLNSRLSSDSVTVIYDGQTYVNKKHVKAKLITQINTSSLALVFGENLMRINKLPLKFSGNLNFLQHGYEMDLKIDSRKTTLENIFTAIPPDMTSWLDNTDIKGDTRFNTRLNGIYDKERNLMPSLQMSLNINDGYISYKGATKPLQNLSLDVEAQLPSLNTDSLGVRIDTLSFTLGKGYLNALFHSVGLAKPAISTTLKANLDLDDLSKAIGLRDLALKGVFDLHLQADGKYRTGQNPRSFRKNDVITSIPSYTLHSSLRNGFVKFASLPEAIHDISFTLNSNCPDNNYHHAKLELKDLNLVALNSVLKGFLNMEDAENPKIDADISGNIHLNELTKYLPMKRFLLSGDMALNIKGSGTYNQSEKLFPVLTASLRLANGEVHTPYFPQPLTRINIQTDIENKSGKLSGTVVNIQPVSFIFEGQPFMLKADLSNPENLNYSIISKGTLNLGNLYKVFGIPGYNATGFIKADVSLNGRQRDIATGRYQALNNSGTLALRDVLLRSASFPFPFVIQNGVLRFQRDKVWLDQFHSAYGKNIFQLKGYFENIINYALQDNAVLKGSVSLSTDRLNVDDFTAFDSPDQDASRAGTDSAGNGVVLIPKNLAVQLNARVKEAIYNGVAVKDFTGQMKLDSGKVFLKNVNFKLAEAHFDMDATYEGVTPHRALFAFAVRADSFSIAKAYQDIPIFREMVTSAAKVKGIVGLDYTLSGRLDQNMHPVLPSLSGGGVINLKKVKLLGFRLMNAVSKSTERDALKDPDLSGINLKTTIKNNIITLQRVKLRIAGFRPRFEGQVSLDGELNIKGRLGLPPFGIFGIPFNVSGTSENPVVKLKRDKSGKVLQEKEDTESEDEQLDQPAGQLRKN